MRFIYKNIVNLTVFLSIFSTCYATWADQRANLKKGTISAVGSLALNYELKLSTKPSHEVKLLSDAGFGYFVIDNLMIGASIPMSWTPYPNKAGHLGIRVFTTYFFDIQGIIYPYVGLAATPRYQLAQDVFKFSAGLDTGVLLSLSPSVALDFGFRPELDFKLNSLDPWKITIPAGFLGIKAFF